MTSRDLIVFFLIIFSFIFLIACFPNNTHSGVVCGRADAASGSSPVGVVVLAGLGGQLVCVCAKKVPERLQEVGGEVGGAVAVEKGQSGAECRGGEAGSHSVGDDLPPAVLAVFQGLDEEGVEQEALEVGVLVKGLLDVPQELAAKQKRKGKVSHQEKEKEKKRKEKNQGNTAVFTCLRMMQPPLHIRAIPP